MTDTEKERELPKEGMEMNKENLVELGEKKESSLAADQESVTGNNNLNNFNIDSSKEEEGSSASNEPAETSKDEKSGDSPATNISDISEKPSEEDISETPPIQNKEKSEEEAPSVSDADGSDNSISEIKSEEISPPSGNDLIEQEEVSVPQMESSEIDSSEDNESVEEVMPALEEISNTDEIQDKEDPQVVTTGLLTAAKEEAIKEDKDNENQPENSIAENTKSEDTTTIVAQSPEGEDQKIPIDKNENIETKDVETDNSEEDKDEVHLDDEMEEEEEKDYSLFKKDELINEFEALLKIEDIKSAEKKIKELKPFYQEFVESERKEALQKFLDDGGVEIDFKYIGDALDSRYSNLNDKYKGRRNAYYSELEKSKEDNLTRKQDILEKLRAIVDGEETNASISALKNITKEWRSIGPVPSAYAKSMWATYNILIDRFYDNRSIYFELKELDRKKNLESKLELCEKAEHLLEYDVIKDAVKELNELHEEFKHIGPVPKDMQEVVWQRFKSASDAIYNRRKDYVSGLKKELHENLDSKKQLVDEVAKFDDFDSEKITDWNEKTKEILDLQKKWEAIGGLPREHAKDVNKHFWSSFKAFFNNKNKFFKKLESQRDENLLKKEDLVKRAEELKESSDWEKTAEQLKELQREWKDIGPVPEKNRNEVYKKFKKACDTFFNKRREHSKEVESEYKVNLRKKEEICTEIEKMAEDNDKNIDRFKELQGLFNEIGFVPRNTIKKIQKKFSHASELFLNSFDLSDTEKSELRFAAEVDKLKASPNADKRIHRKEVEIRRLISKIENDIALWKNNIEFFAKSKTADKVKEEFNEKIAQATSQLEELKEEMKVLNKI
jgi:hypothetical protein